MLPEADRVMEEPAEAEYMEEDIQAPRGEVNSLASKPHFHSILRVCSQLYFASGGEGEGGAPGDRHPGGSEGGGHPGHHHHHDKGFKFP